MVEYFSKLSEAIQIELEVIDLDGGDISIEESVHMIKYFEKCLSELRNHFLSLKEISKQDEILFFKEMKPEILGFLLYFNKVHKIELKRPTGSNDTQKEYYENELKSLTFFFERHLDFYQYYRARSVYMDECYFLRGKSCYEICADSTYFIRDPLFSTGYDYKVAKINCNEMLRIFLNKKMNSIDKLSLINKNRSAFPASNLKWTGSKVAAVEFGYSLHSSPAINRGSADIKDIMLFIETYFNIDLGDYYRTYVAIKNRKRDRTPFLNSLINSLIKRMNEDDAKN